MRKSWFLLGLTLLSSCGPNAPKPAAPVADNAVNSSAGNATALAAEGDRYSCKDGRQLSVVASEDSVQLTIDGARHILPSVVSASGARYKSDSGLTPGNSLVWWSKGDEAMLIEAPLGKATSDDGDEKVVNCVKDES